MKQGFDELPVTGWYPGHMLRAGREMQERLKLVDVVVELLDARLPSTSRNPAFAKIFGHKPRCLVFTKASLADPDASQRWEAWLSANGHAALFVDSTTGEGLERLIPAWGEIAERRRRESGAKRKLLRPLRIMIAGIPNVGKSTLVNRLVASKRAQVGPRPGVTRNQQWIRIGDSVDLLDTPGVLWPRIRAKRTELKLGLIGAIKDELIGAELLAEYLWDTARNAPESLSFARYGLATPPDSPEELLEAVGRRRGWLGAGGTVDACKSATMILKEFRDGQLGRATLDPIPAD